MADEQPKPVVKPEVPSNPPDRANTKPTNLQAPIFPVRDPSDPLDPQRLASEEFSVRRILQEADRVIRIVRPNLYGDYRDLIGQLEGYFVAYRNYSAWGEYDFKRADLFMRDLSNIKLEGIEGLKARDEARKAVGESWRTWWSVYNTFKALAKRYSVLAHVKDDLVSGVTRPPSSLPELV
jgi:hypothetical protein